MDPNYPNNHYLLQRWSQLMIGKLRFLFINIYLLKWETHTQGVKMITLLKKAPFVLVLLIGEIENELILQNVSVDTKCIQFLTDFDVQMMKCSFHCPCLICTQEFHTPWFHWLPMHYAAGWHQKELNDMRRRKVK